VILPTLSTAQIFRPIGQGFLFGASLKIACSHRKTKLFFTLHVLGANALARDHGISGINKKKSRKGQQMTKVWKSGFSFS
jgi:hypothetical protein